jgi:hypothetical protein
VLEKPHKVGRRDLSLSLYKPAPKKQKAARQQSREPETEEEEPPKKTVVVDVGQRDFESEDTYELYFESKRCGGGEVEEISFDKEKKLVYVTFHDPEGKLKVPELWYSFVTAIPIAELAKICGEYGEECFTVCFY